MTGGFGAGLGRGAAAGATGAPPSGGAGETAAGAAAAGAAAAGASGAAGCGSATAASGAAAVAAARGGRVVPVTGFRRATGSAGASGGFGGLLGGGRGGRGGGWSGGSRCNRRLRRGFRCRLGRGGGLCEDAPDEIGDLIRDDAQLVLRFENAAETVVEERDQLFRGQADFFSKFENACFCRSQVSSQRAVRAASSISLGGRSHVSRASARSPNLTALAPLVHQRSALMLESTVVVFDHRLFIVIMSNYLLNHIRTPRMQDPGSVCSFLPS